MLHRLTHIKRFQGSIAGIALCMLVMVATAVAPARADTGKIAGTITDEAGEVLPGANVIVVAQWEDGEEVEIPRPQGGVSDANGKYFIINLRPGTYTLRASFVGFATVEKQKIEVNSNKTTTVDFVLAEQSLEGGEITVVAYNPTQVDLDKTSTMQSYSMDALESVPGINDVEDLLDLQADVVDGHFRGGREGEASYVMGVGGASINNPLSGKTAFSPMVVGIEEVEVFTSGFSAEYGSAQSGVVNIVTKEGGNSWQVSTDLSFAAPHHAHWGGSYYDPEDLPFYQLLNDTDEWLQPVPGGAGEAEVGSLFDALWNRYYQGQDLTRADSMRFAELSRKQFLSYYRNVGLDYQRQFNYRLDLSVGGPIAENTRLFAALRQERSPLDMPHPLNDDGRQFMGNIAHHLTPRDKIKLSVNYSWRQRPSLGPSNRGAFFRIYDSRVALDNAGDFGLSWQHVFSDAVVMDWRARIFDTFSADWLWYREPMGIDQDDKNAYYNDKVSMPTSHRYFFEDEWIEEDTRTMNLIGSITSQIGSHLMKSGLQLSAYNINVFGVTSLGNPTRVNFQDFTDRPFEGALYVQDKMEFKGMNAHVGLRLDFFDFNKEYFADQYSPLRNPDYDPDAPYNEREPYYLEPENAVMDQTEMFFSLQPRLGVAFPVSENAVVHLNYGNFTQRPSFNQVLYYQIQRSGVIEDLGNPRLDPEQTIAYDAGIVFGLPFETTLEFSTYFKDVQNLTQRAYYLDEQDNIYGTYVNINDASIKGFHVNLERNVGSLRTILRYNYQRAVGEASTPFETPVTFRETPAQGEDAADLPDPRDMPLNFDRPHRVVGVLSYAANRNAGPEFFGSHPLGNVQFSAKFKVQSGRPFTWDVKGLGLKNNERAPTEYDVSLTLQKQFKVDRVTFMPYLEGFNLLNTREYAARVFSNIDYRERYMDGERGDDLLYDETDGTAPYVTPEDQLIYGNRPRYFRLGLKAKF